MELILVFVVALLVIGPDKLPGAVRTGSLWLGRFRRSYNKVKSEIERELNTDEIKRQLHNEAVLEEIEQAKAHVKKIADETKVSVDALVSSTSFDPGASSATESQLVNDRRAKIEFVIVLTALLYQGYLLSIVQTLYSTVHVSELHDSLLIVHVQAPQQALQSAHLDLVQGQSWSP